MTLAWVRRCSLSFFTISQHNRLRTVEQKNRNSLGCDDALSSHVDEDAVLRLDVLAAHVGERRVLHGPVPELARRHHAHVVHLGTLPNNTVRDTAGNPQELPEKARLLARLLLYIYINILNGATATQRQLVMARQIRTKYVLLVVRHTKTLTYVLFCATRSFVLCGLTALL